MTIKSWVEDLQAAFRQQSYGKTSKKRIAGYERAQHNFALLMMIAIFPTLLAIPFAPWSTATLIGKTVIVGVCLWAVSTLAVGFFLIFRSVARVAREKEPRDPQA